MLYSNLKHIESSTHIETLCKEQQDFVVCIGSMDMSSIKIYTELENLQSDNTHFSFYDLEFLNPEFEEFLKQFPLIKSEILPCIIVCKHNKVDEVLYGYAQCKQVKKNISN